MSSIKDQIVDFVVGSSCLTFATGQPSGLVVERSTGLPSPPETAARIRAIVGPETAEGVGNTINGYPMRRYFTLILECLASAPSGNADELLDPVVVWAEKRLFNDETFGGLAVNVSSWRVEQDNRLVERTYGMATIAAGIQFITIRGNPEVQTQ